MNTKKLLFPYNTSQITFCTFLVLTTILFFTIYRLTPLETDDYWYLEGTQGMNRGWDMFVVCCKRISQLWYTDPGRFCNLISPVFLALLPKWIFDLSASICIFFTIVAGCKFANVELGSLKSYLFTAAIVFCYPWYDYFFCTIFALNYIFSILFILWAANIILKDINPRHHSSMEIMSKCMLCFLAGWFHEGLSAPLLCGVITLWLVRIVDVKYIHSTKTSPVSKQFLLETLSLAIGFSMIFISPVFWNRANYMESLLSKLPIKEMVMQIGPSLAILLLFIVLLIIVLSIPKFRKRIMTEPCHYERLSFLLIYVLAAFTVMIKYYNGPRTASGVLMFSFIGIAFLLGFIRFSIPRVLSILSKSVIALCVLIHLGYTVKIQRKILDEYYDIVALFKASPTGTIYYDQSFPVLDMSLFKTSLLQFHTRIPKSQISHFLDDEKNMVILPTSLKGFSESKLKATSSEGFYIFDGYIIANPDIHFESPRLTVVSAKGDTIMTRYRLDEFIDTNNKTWILVIPHEQTLNPQIRFSDVLPNT